MAVIAQNKQKCLIFVWSLLFNSFFNVFHAHFKVQTKIMRIFSYYLNVFELPPAVFSFNKNYFKFLSLNTKNICKYESFLIYCNVERETFKENNIVVNKILFLT